MGGDVNLFYDESAVQVWHGDARDVLQRLDPESVHCCITSPPY